MCPTLTNIYTKLQEVKITCEVTPVQGLSEVEYKVRQLEEKLAEKDEMLCLVEQKLKDARGQLVKIGEETKKYMQEEPVSSKHYTQYKRLHDLTQEEILQSPTEESRNTFLPSVLQLPVTGTSSVMARPFSRSNH